MLIEQFKAYIDHMETPAGFTPTGVDKQCYLDLMEQCLGAYCVPQMEAMEPQEDFQGYARLLSTMGVLLSQGRIPHLLPLFVCMMDCACRAIEGQKGEQALDFCIKELMLAYRATKQQTAPQKQKEWHNLLSRVSPFTHYSQTSGESHNINIYNMSGEWLRQQQGMTDVAAYYDHCWPHQLKRFDSTGMYLDEYPKNRNPMLYDITTRVQIQLILGEGYNGPYAEALDDHLCHGGLFTLFTQSSAYELPFGGRSNQYLFNEALIAANGEFEAARWHSLGNDKLAGAFKRSAHLAIRSITRWLLANKHIKNFYQDHTIGTEPYGNYNKYMITMASFLSIGFLYAQDEIREQPCPAEVGGFAFALPPTFHKVFANCGGYFVELETDADFHYDSNGLGRIHKTGIPTELALSIPFAAHPNYTVQGTTANRSICPGWADEDTTEIRYLSERDDLPCQFTIIKQEQREVVFSLQYGTALTQVYTLCSEGVTIYTKLLEGHTLCYCVPLLQTNGRDKTEIAMHHQGASVTMGQFAYHISGDVPIKLTDECYVNRNGAYTMAQFQSKTKELTLALSLHQSLHSD